MTTPLLNSQTNTGLTLTGRLNTIRLCAWLGADSFKGDPQTNCWEVPKTHKEDSNIFQGLENYWIVIREQVAEIFVKLGEDVKYYTHLLKKTSPRLVLNLPEK